MLKTKTSKAEATAQGIKVWFEGEKAPPEPQTYDLVLVSVGRSPNGKRIGAENAGIAVDERGFIATDSQMRTNVGHIFAIGDVAKQPMLAHKAVHEGHVAAEAAAGRKSHFDARVIPSVAYTDPEVAWCGLTETEAKAKNIEVKVAKFPWGASGRALTLDRTDGLTKLVIEPETERILGVGIAGVGAGDLISEGVLAVEMGATARDLAESVHPHPTLSETLMEAAESFYGTATHTFSRRNT